MAEVARHMADAFDSIRLMQSVREGSIDGAAALARCVTSYSAQFGGLLMVGVHQAATSHLEHHKEDELVDIAAYVNDMERDHADDMAYELARDEA